MLQLWGKNVLDLGGINTLVTENTFDTKYSGYRGINILVTENTFDNKIFRSLENNSYYGH